MRGVSGSRLQKSAVASIEELRAQNDHLPWRFGIDMEQRLKRNGRAQLREWADSAFHSAPGSKRVSLDTGSVSRCRVKLSPPKGPGKSRVTIVLVHSILCL